MILIFGGGDNQLTLIKSAKERGYYTVVIDPNKNVPGKEIADAFEIVAPKDFEGTCSVVEKHNIKGIATAQMENPLMLMAVIAEKYNFIFPKVEAIKRSRNKYLMKESFLNTGVPCAKGKLFKAEYKILEEELKEFSYPLIIKPVDAFSSRGVMKVIDFNELKKFEPETRKFSSDGEIIVEEFLEGQEMSVESITFRGKTHILQYTEKIITPYPYTVEMGHIQPAELSDKQKEVIDKAVIKAIASLGLDNIPCHTELKLTENGPVIIEVGARLGGDYIASYLTLHSTGVNMDAATADVAMGNLPDIKMKLNQYSGIFYFHLGEGKKVSAINDWQKILHSGEAVYAALFIKPGDLIPRLTDSAKRSGFIILKDISKKILLEKAEVNIKYIQQSVVLS